MILVKTEMAGSGHVYVRRCSTDEDSAAGVRLYWHTYGTARAVGRFSYVSPGQAVLLGLL